MSERTVDPQKKPTPAALTPASSGLLRLKCACGDTPSVDGECAECRKKRLGLQRSAIGAAEPAIAPPIVHEVLRSPGQPLDAGTQRFMETRLGHNFSRLSFHTPAVGNIQSKLAINSPNDPFEREADQLADQVIHGPEPDANPKPGHDFSRVRIHTDNCAAESARTVNALAYTVGEHIVFGAGQYQPQTNEGKRLLAHELTHVTQQGVSLQTGVVSPSSAALFRKEDNPLCKQDETELDHQMGTHEWLIGCYFKSIEPDAQLQFAYASASRSGRPYHADIAVVKDKTVDIYEIKTADAIEEAMISAEYFIFLAKERCNTEMDKEKVGAKKKREWRLGKAFPGKPSSKVPIPNPVSGKNIYVWQDPDYPGAIAFDAPKEEKDHSCGEDKNEVASMYFHEALISEYFKRVSPKEPDAQRQYKIPTGEPGKKAYKWADIVLIKDANKEAFIYEIKPKEDASRGKKQVLEYIKLAQTHCDKGRGLNWQTGNAFSPAFIPHPFTGRVLHVWQDFEYPGVILYETVERDPKEKTIPIYKTNPKDILVPVTTDTDLGKPVLVNVDNRDFGKWFDDVGWPLPVLPIGDTLLLTVSDALYQSVKYNRDMLRIKDTLDKMKIDFRSLPVYQFGLLSTEVMAVFALAWGAGTVIPLIIEAFAAGAMSVAAGVAVESALGTATTAAAGTAVAETAGGGTVTSLTAYRLAQTAKLAKDIKQYAKAAGVLLGLTSIGWGASEAQAQEVITKGLEDPTALVPVHFPGTEGRISTGSVKEGDSVQIEGRTFRTVAHIVYRK